MKDSFADHRVSPTVYRLMMAACVIVALWAYAFASQQIFNPDPCVFGEAAQQLLDGGQLYDDVWEDKPPLAMLAYALPQVLAPGSMAGLQVFLGLILLTAGFFAAREARTTEGRLLVFAVLVLLPLGHIDLLWLSTEHIANVFVLVVLWCLIKEHRDHQRELRYAVIAGVAVACTFHVRQTTVIVGFLYAAWLLVTAGLPMAGRLRRLAVFVGSGLLTWLLFIIAVALWADLGGYIHTVLLYPGQYAEIGSWKAATKLLVESAPTLLPLVAAMLLAAGWGSPLRKLSLTTLATGVLMCVLPRRTAIHYLASLFPMLVLLVWVADSRRAETIRAMRVMAAGIIVAGLANATMTLWHIADAPSARWMHAVVDRVAELAGEDSTLWVVGPKVSTYIHFAAANPPANTYWVAFRLDQPQVETLLKPRPEIMAEYLKQPPEVLVVYAEQLKKKFAAGATPEPPDAILNSGELLDNLLLSTPYRHRETISNFAILTLQ